MSTKTATKKETKEIREEVKTLRNLVNAQNDKIENLSDLLAQVSMFARAHKHIKLEDSGRAMFDENLARQVQAEDQQAMQQAANQARQSPKQPQKAPEEPSEE